MQLAEISIRRPVLATVLSLLVLLIGAVSFNRLSVREYPRIDEPVVTVSVRYGGASAEVMEAQVTKPLEDSIAGIDAVDVITSLSRAEQSQISVRFRLEKDADNAAAEVRDRTSRVRNRLPDGVDEPVIAKVEADAVPVMWLASTLPLNSGAGLIWSGRSSSTSLTESTTMPTVRLATLRMITTVKASYFTSSSAKRSRMSTMGTITPRRLTTPFRKAGALAMRVGCS